MIKGVIFDADGVLFDSMPFWKNIGKIYLKTKGIEAEEDLNQKLETFSMEEGADYLVKRYALSITSKEVLKEINGILKEYYRNMIPLKEGVREYLQRIEKKKIPMAVATSGDRALTELALQRCSVDQYFYGIFTCTDAGKSKRFPDVYDLAMNRITEDTKREEILVFEDAYHALCTVKQAGFQTIAVYDRENDKDWEKIKEIADQTIEKYQDFDQTWKRVMKK